MTPLTRDLSAARAEAASLEQQALLDGASPGVFTRYAAASDKAESIERLRELRDRGLALTRAYSLFATV